MSKLMDLCFNITDGEHGTVIDDPKGNFFLLSNKNIVNGKVNIDPKLDRRINESTFNKINKRTKIETNDVLISTVGTIGKTSIVEKSVNFAVQRSVGIIKTNHQKLNPYYLKYQLMTSEFQNRLKLLSKGAVQKCLFIEDLKNLEVLCPSIETQNKVAHTLKILEDKISNNNKINAELESLAKTIYDYWFLQFEFPNEEGKPYKSSGGKMFWNKELKREIPEGWAVKKLNSIANLYQPEILPSNLMKEDGKYFVYGANGIVGRYNKFNHEHPEIAICCRGASCGNYLMTLPKSWITGNSMVVTPKDSSVTKEYLYHSLRYIDIKRYVTGSAQPQITRSNLDGIKVVIPPFKSLEHFSNKAEKIRNELIKNINENNELSSLRDFLLPMLMNGQVQFK